MPADDIYQSWKKTKTECHPPGDLADRVMTSIHEHAGRPRSSALRDRLVALASSKQGRVAVCILASAAYLFRLRQVVSVFLE